MRRALTGVLIAILARCAGVATAIEPGEETYALRLTVTSHLPVPKVTSHGPNAAAGDLNGDGRADILTCVEWSVYPFYSRAAIEMKERPSYRLGRVRELDG